jgi:hypothetical protein
MFNGKTKKVFLKKNEAHSWAAGQNIKMRKISWEKYRSMMRDAWGKNIFGICEYIFK